MITLDTRNVQQALPQGIALIREHGVREKSRGGDVLRIPEPVTTVYRRPCERVLFHPWRDANPFFHLVESIWMLAGRDDLKALTPYVATMKDFSDDGGVTQPGAYGKRWRGHFFTEDRQHIVDQLSWVVKRLRGDPGDRRVVIQMWDPEADTHAADHGGRDVPCNLTALPYVSGGHLHLTVFCRSNDMIWGAYGANAVHFSVLLEYLAGRIGLPVGTMTQVSNNFHAYVERMPQGIWDASKDPYTFTAYEGNVPELKAMYSQAVRPLDMFQEWPDEVGGGQGWRERIMQEDLCIFFEHGTVEAATKARWPWLRRVAVPMALAHAHWKKAKGEERYTVALEILERCQASDWRRAGEEWIERRHQSWLLKQGAQA